MALHVAAGTDTAIRHLVVIIPICVILVVVLGILLLKAILPAVQT